jgi:hypothetical protein
MFRPDAGIELAPVVSTRGRGFIAGAPRKGAIADFRKTRELLPDLAQPRRMLRELGVKL